MPLYWSIILTFTSFTQDYDLWVYDIMFEEIKQTALKKEEVNNLDGLQIVRKCCNVSNKFKKKIDEEERKKKRTNADD